MNTENIEHRAAGVFGIETIPGEAVGVMEGVGIAN